MHKINSFNATTFITKDVLRFSLFCPMIHLKLKKIKSNEYYCATSNHEFNARAE